MTRRTWLATGIALLAAACTPGLKGSGNSKTEKREVAAFQKVRASGGLTVKIGVGPEQKVEVTGDDNIVQLIESKVSDGRLELKFGGQSGFRSVVPLEIRVVTATLAAVSASGGTTIEIAGVQRSELEI